jgi:L-ascorbate metabolism protein UlaG (beta-lactamase superfamily)
MRRFLLVFLLLAVGGRAEAAGCAPVASLAPRVWPAAASPDDGAVRISFLGHASFEIVSPGGVRAVTDYNGVNIPELVPDIATMNHAHSTHYTLHPDPRIPHVLHGWSEDGKMPVFDLSVDDMHVTNVATNIRTWGGETEVYGNSIFVFQTGGLCIAHLSHLHHLLEPADLDALGHIDIVMVAVDGAFTMSQRDAAAVVAQLQPQVVLPMHYFTTDVLGTFLDLERATYAIDSRASPAMRISRATLPEKPTVIVLPGGY